MVESFQSITFHSVQRRGNRRLGGTLVSRHAAGATGSSKGVTADSEEGPGGMRDQA